MNNKELVNWLRENIEKENDFYQNLSKKVDLDDLHRDSYYIEKLERHFQRASVFEEVLIEMGYSVDE